MRYSTLVSHSLLVSGASSLFGSQLDIKELIAQLDHGQFWQVHRGTVVNARQIVSAHHDLLGKVSLNLRDRPEKVAVSRSYAHLFRQM